MLTPDEEKEIKSLTKKLDKFRSSNDYTWIHHFERKIEEIRQRGYNRDEHPNMGLPKGSLYYINYDNYDD